MGKFTIFPKYMARVKFTSALKRFFPDLKDIEVDASNIKELVSKVDQVYPGISSYILDDDLTIRKHVNIFVREEIIDGNIADVPITEKDEVHIFQALSGG